MSEAFESIMRGLIEVKNHRDGKLILKSTTIEIAPLPHYDAKMVKALREVLGFSMSVFADVLGVSKKTVEAWESGRNIPSGAARRFLQVISKDMGILHREKIIVHTFPATRSRSTTGVTTTKQSVTKNKLPIT